MPLKRIAYYSKATSSLNEDSCADLAAFIGERNRQNRVTGVMVFTVGTFFQVIEGEQRCIEDLYRKIENDTRHREVNKVLDEEIDVRLFKNWAMEMAEIKQGRSYSVTMEILEDEPKRAEEAPEHKSQLMRSLSLYYKNKRLFYATGPNRTEEAAHAFEE